MGTSTEPTVHFLNVEYFFRLLYELVSGTHGFSLGTSLLTLASQVWLIVTALSVIVTIGLLAVFIHATTRFHQVRREEEALFSTLNPVHAEEVRDHRRWDHVRSLVESPNESDWRQAIIEADIMLDDLLSQLGYPGTSVGEKLRVVDPARFHTLKNAGEAHGIRNDIAHRGSSFELTEHMAHRTIAMYESVMREHGEI